MTIISRSFSSLLLPICLLSSTAASGMSGHGSSPTVATKREVYVPPDVNKLTPDARMWYLAGVSNADKDLTSFGSIVQGLQAGDNVNDLLKSQLRSLLGQVTVAADNTRTLVPKLTYLVNSFVSWTRNPSWLDKVKLKATLSYVNGKRDNKSYYLQNGAGLWCQLRLDKYLRNVSEPTDATVALTGVLDNLEQGVLLARDTLDGAAQVYVKGVVDLVPLVSDIGTNEVKIRSIVDGMKSAMDSAGGSVVATANDSVSMVQQEIDSLRSN